MKLSPQSSSLAPPFPPPLDACEHCDESVGEGDHHSFILGLNIYSRTEGYTYNQCDSVQHYACSHEHAVAQVVQCLHEHPPTMPPYRKDFQITMPDACAICGKAIGDTGYRYTLTYAMAGRNAEGKHYNSYTCRDEHWCCSLEHAKEAAEACLEEHLKDGPHG